MKLAIGFSLAAWLIFANSYAALSADPGKTTNVGGQGMKKNSQSQPAIPGYGNQPMKWQTNYVAARLVDVEKVGDQVFVRCEAAFGVPAPLSHGDATTQAWLASLPSVGRFQVKLLTGEIPKNLRKNDLVDLTIAYETKLFTYPKIPHDSFPPPPPRYITVSTIVALKKSDASRPSRTFLVSHTRKWDRSCEYVYSDGTIVVTYGVNPVSVASGILSAPKLAALKESIAACNFEKFGKSFHDASDVDSSAEYLSNPEMNSVSFMGENPTAPANKKRVVGEEKLPVESKSAKAVLAMLEDCHSRIIDSAPKRLFYEMKYSADAYGPPYSQVYGEDGKYRTEGTKLALIAKPFPLITGVKLADITKSGLPISNETYAKHKDVFNNTFLRVINTYFREGKLIYSNLELDFQPLPSMRL